MISLGARVSHPSFGEGIVCGEEGTNWKIFFREGDQTISKGFDGFTILEYGFQAEESGVDMEYIEDALRNVLKEMEAIQHPVDLGEKWEGGNLIMQPGKSGLQNKEVPIEAFFHKIVMMRDRLRVLEQNINAHKVLTDEDKVNLQQYITRCYGSMTTFNVLFDNKEDYFVGEKKS